jgi:cytochrome b561
MFLESINIQSFQHCYLVCFFVIPILGFILSSTSGEKGHQKIHICLCWYMGGDLETLHEEHAIRAFALASHRCL